MSWVLAIGVSSFPTDGELAPIALALPWSLFLFNSGGGPLVLFAIFVSGMVNAGIIYLVAGGWRRVASLRRGPFLLPPAR
jgi:hypothetical protein